MVIHCENCLDEGEIISRVQKGEGVSVFRIPCQECCEHNEHDHGICLDCGKDNYEDLAAQAYDRAKDLMKYGE